MTTFLWFVFITSAVTFLYFGWMCTAKVSGGFKGYFSFRLIPMLLCVASGLIVGVFGLHWLTGVPLPVK